MAEKYNVPGNVQYKDTQPIDVVLRSMIDSHLRGYWLARDADGQLCFVSNQNEADHLYIDTDTDGTALIHWTDETQEFSFNESDSTIRVKRYS